MLARKEQKWKRKEEIQDQRLAQQQLKRVVRHHKDPLGLDALTDLLVGHHKLFNGHYGGLLEHYSGGGLGHGRPGHGGPGHGRPGHGGHGSHGSKILDNYLFFLAR